MLLAFLVVSVLALQIWWMSRRIRGDFAQRGEPVASVRWQPLRGLFERTRRQMLFEVRYTDRSGAAATCLVVWTLFVGYTIEEQRALASSRAPRVSSRNPITIPWIALVGAVVCFAVIGLPYLAAPYNKLSLPSSLYGPGLILLGILGGALQYTQPSRWRSTGLILFCAPLAVVSVRIAMDLTRNPGSHNLFPFELAIAGFVAGVTVAAGMGLGALLRRLTPGFAPARR